MKKPRVLVAMSGGVDSSLAAILLQEEGYDCVGVTMKTWDYALSGSSHKETGCCNLDSMNDARTLAVQRGFPHYILDLREEFGNFVIDNFISEYMAGKTPNPCILCNTHIKWAALLKKADKMNCDFIATGHYAKIRQENYRFIIYHAKDITKDQTYALWGLSQDCLIRTIFPLGNLIKKQTRELVKKYGFSQLSAKPDSYEICFIPDNDYRGFLKRQSENNNLHHSPNQKYLNFGDGNFVLKNGEIIGKHKGYPYYTIGQRKGLGIALGYPAYVTEINPTTNTVTLGKAEDAYRQGLFAVNLNWIKYDSIHGPMKVISKIRYKDKGTPSEIVMDGNKVKVTFDEPVFAIAPGQSVVFYENEDVVGGGIIEKSF